MKKKKISLLGAILIILFAIFEINGIDINNLTLDLNNEKDIKQEPTINEIELNEIKEEDLKVYYLDVGQADCVLIQNNNENMLIDAGNNEDGDKIVKYLKELGVEKFKYVVPYFDE